jgi:cytochrome c oxidase subunit 3
MAHGDVKHDYHLVEPSPWPVFGSLSALIMAWGGIIYIKGLFGLPKGTPWVLILGFLMIAYTMFSWWRDVIREAEGGFHTRVVQIGLRYGMLLFIASEVMFFVAWFWSYFSPALFPGSAIEVAREAYTGGVWPPKGIETPDAWGVPLTNTLILLTSGTTITWAHHAILHGNRKGLKWGLLLTILLGICFTTLQGFEYTHSEFGFGGGAYNSAFFMATGFHGFHVIIGTLFLTVCLLRALAGQFTAKQHFGLEAAAWYWHFVDVVWLFLFASIYVWGSSPAGG